MVLSILEWAGAITAILSVALNTKRVIWAWPLGMLSSLIYAAFFFQIKLYADMSLQGYFFLQCSYGWYYWMYGSKVPDNVPVSRLKPLQWLSTILAIAGLTAAMAWFFITFTDASVPEWDSFTTASSIVAQLLLARKVLGNWIIWIITDIVATGVYLYKEAFVTAGLYAVFVIMASYGLYDWYQQWKKQRMPSS